jgi:hypothetical protein
MRAEQSQDGAAVGIAERVERVRGHCLIVTPVLP